MAEIDPVILELRADLGKYRADLQSTTTKVNRLLGQQEGSAKRLEMQMRKSSLGISTSIVAISTAMGAAFSGRELTSILDSFTRMQNSLRVAGLEGEALKGTQDRLFASAQKYGVELEGLAGLYSTTSQAAKGFGASQAQVFKVTDSVSAALKITGQSSQQAAGSLLQLGQAFRSPKVQAEEFNSLIDGMYPLLEAAASGSDRWRGDVSKLIAEVKKGKVTGQEFFNAIAAGSAMLEAKAAKATLTLAAGYATLSNAITVYFGEADKANGVSAALGEALRVLAENLDTVISALAVIGISLASQLAAGALVGGTALRSLAAYASIATTSLAGASLAARAAGASLITAFGGPVAIAITAVAVGLAYVATQSDKAAKATGQYAKQAEALKKIQEKVTDATDRLATATGKARAETLAHTKALREEAKQYLANAQAALIAAEAKAVQVREKARSELASLPVNSGAGGGPDRLNGVLQRTSRPLIDANANARQAEENVIQARKEIQRLTNIIDAASPPAISADVKPDKKKSGSRTVADPLDDVFRNAQELRQLQLEELRAKEQDAVAASEKADYARQALNMESEIRRKDIDEAVRKKQLTEEEANARRKIIDNLYGAADEITVLGRETLYQREITRREEAQLARQRSDAMRDELEALGAEAGVTDVRKSRVLLERRMLELQQQIERNLLDEAIASGDILDATEARATLARRQAAERAGFEKSNAGPMGQYIEEIRKVGINLEDEFEDIAVNGLKSLNDGITDAIMNSENLGDVFKNVAKSIIEDLIRIAIQQTIVNSLMSVMGGGSGGKIRTPGIGDLQGSIGGSSALHPLTGTFNRASGGYVAPGQTVRVNEHRGGAEYLRMGSQGGHVIPLGQVNQQAARPQAQGGGVVRLMIEEAPGFASRVQVISEEVSVEVTRTMAKPLIEAAATETMRRSSRPTLGRSI